MTAMPLHPFVNREDQRQRVLAELERMVARLESTVGEARRVLAELRAERCRDGGVDRAGASGGCDQ